MERKMVEKRHAGLRAVKPPMRKRRMKPGSIVTIVDPVRSIGDRLFVAFVAAWFAGLAAGGTAVSYYWDGLRFNIGVILLITVTVTVATAALVVEIIIRRIHKTG